ncbi:MAG: hypothetical protein COB14_01525 [Alphaproteobacteria bacterium]|nr:MAG: hypothetical protein COB14_01525 [Alphaproteobacteria bacterium]
MSEDNNLHLADLIQSVKNELIESSRRSEEDQEENGTSYLFALEEVELELKFYVSTTIEGKVKGLIFSAQAGGESAKEQTAKIKFKVHKNPDENSNDSDTKNIWHSRTLNILAHIPGVNHFMK